MKKTTELSKHEKEEICALFKRSFNSDLPLEVFENIYAKAYTGYSYHSLMIENNDVVGFLSAIPFKYSFFDKECIFAMPANWMIDKKYRGKMIHFYSIGNLLFDILKKEGISFIYACPRDYIKKLYEKVLGLKEFGNIYFYVLPIHIGTLNKKYEMLNLLSKSFASIVNTIPKSLNKLRTVNFKYNIEKINDNKFLNHRYNFYPINYNIIPVNQQSFFVYTMESFFPFQALETINKAIIIDVYPLEKKLLESAVKYIYDNNPYLDVILYMGNLNFKPINLYRVPKAFDTEKFCLAGKLLRDDIIDERIFTIKNWNINLSNIDIF